MMSLTDHSSGLSPQYVMLFVFMFHIGPPFSQLLIIASRTIAVNGLIICVMYISLRLLTYRYKVCVCDYVLSV